MKWGRGHVDPWWDESFKELSYALVDIPNQEDIPIWEKDYRPDIDCRKGYVYDMKQKTPDYGLPFITMMKDWQNVGISFFKQTCFQVLPTHSDNYKRYRQVFDIEDPSVIYRCVVFLEDWKSGHYLEVDGTPVLPWKKGDYVWWNFDTPHYSGNFGKENKYTMQITGMLSG